MQGRGWRGWKLSKTDPLDYVSNALSLIQFKYIVKFQLVKLDCKEQVLDVVTKRDKTA